MTHYQDIHLSPDEETGAPVLMSMLFARLHGALVHLRSTGIGVSFPEVERTLGACLQGYRTVSRRQFKSSPERLMRRHARRHGLSAEEAARQVLDQQGQRSALPFVQLKSSSTGQRFCLFVEHGALQGQECPGSFSAYGLSATATIPWF